MSNRLENLRLVSGGDRDYNNRTAREVHESERRFYGNNKASRNRSIKITPPDEERAERVSKYVLDQLGTVILPNYLLWPVL